MSDRSGPVQAEPDLRWDYTGFPAVRIRSGTRRWRVHRRRFSPWFWASGPGGRFNLDPPYGTLYTASRAEVALRESAGTVLVAAAAVDSDWADQRVASRIAVDGGRLADFRSGRAPGFGVVPGEISGPFPDYQLPRIWAATLHGCRFGGIRYMSRFAPPDTGVCEAYFAGAGPADRPVIQTVTIRSLVRDLPGYRIAERPSSMDITIHTADPPPRD